MAVTNFPGTIKAPTKGLTAVANIMQMPPGTALALDNWIAFPDAIQQRPGSKDYVTGFTDDIVRLWTYSAANGTTELFGTSDSGVYDCTVAGAAPAASIALTQGKTNAAQISTGANSYLFIVNGVDSLVQYDGAAWTSVALLGATATNTLSAVVVHRQRVYFAVKDSLTLAYLAPNSISGAPTTYELGAIFAKGGYIVALGTWTIDGGSGAEDLLAVATSEGEIAVFNGSDPSTEATWEKRGVYYIGKPLSTQCLIKYGGDLLFLCEAGLYPLSRALLAASIDRTQSISEAIRPLISALSQSYLTTDGWEMIVQPNIPLLIVNVPRSPTKLQFAMHITTGAWSTFSGWEALAFGLMGNELFFSTGEKVLRVEGTSDNGANIVSTMLTGYTQLKSARSKRAVMIKPYMQPFAAYSFGVSLARDFQVSPSADLISVPGSGSIALWGSALFGSSFWAATDSVFQNWSSINDTETVWKALYLQVASMSASVRFLGADFRLLYSKGMGY